MTQQTQWTFARANLLRTCRLCCGLVVDLLRENRCNGFWLLAYVTFGEFLVCINGNLLNQYNIILAVWISLGFVTFAGYASCIKYQFVGM